jgi:hypothetical protein
VTTRVFYRARITPFIKIDGRSYYFNIHGLTDNLYRAVERALRRDDPTGLQGWNKRQQQSTEKCALQLFARLLPRSDIHGSVHYQFDDDKGAAQWAECDGLVLYDKHLFVVEAKAGAYTAKPPGSYLEAHINSVKKLIRSAAEQANRFHRTLAEKGTVEICNERHERLFTLNRNEFDDIVLCCVTLDQIEHIASHSEDLTEIGIELGGEPTWCVSIDDLRIYADIFTNPLFFLDFINERMRASKSSACRVKDEMDHLGLYLAQNRYVLHAERFGGIPTVGWLGFRDELDEYYAEVFKGKSPQPPNQGLPRRLKQIIDLLAQSRRIGRAAAATKILWMDGETRETFAASIDDIIRLQAELKRPRPLTMGGDIRITCFVNQKSVVQSTLDSAIDHTLAVMHVQKESDRTLFCLSYSEFGLLEDVRWALLSAKDIEEMDAAKLKVMTDRIQASRRKLKSRPIGDSGRTMTY